MDMIGEQLILAPRAKVWSALNDPEILRQAIPGCETVAKEGDTVFLATVVAKVGPVKATFKGKVTLSEIDPPNGYRITGEGQGGAAGFGKGGAKVTLEDAPNGQTLLKYQAQAQVGGKLAQIGSRLVDATAKKLAEEFFSHFNQIVSAEMSLEPEAQPASTPSMAEQSINLEAHNNLEPIAPSPSSPVTPRKGLPPWLWAGGLAIAVLLLLWASR